MNARRLSLASCASLFVAMAMLLALAGAAVAALPDNRAYELVSPIEKGGKSYLPDLAVADASGDRVVVDGGPQNAVLSTGASWMVETHTSTGWSGVQIGPHLESNAQLAKEPPQGYFNTTDQTNTALVGVSEDFSRFAFETTITLDPRNTIAGSSGVYVSDAPGGPFSWVSGPHAPAVEESEPGECPEDPYECITDKAAFAGASADLSDVVWGQYHPLVAPPGLLPGSPADTHAYGYEVYESASGVARLVGLVPAGEGVECGPGSGSCVVPQCGAAMGNQSGASSFHSNFAPALGAVSGDGSQVIFASPDPDTEGVPGCAPAGVYVRQEGTSTVDVSASQRKGGDPNGPRRKVYAGSAGSGGRIDTVFFTSSEELTEDSNTGSADQGNDLYAYSLGTGRLTDLTPDSNALDPNGAGVISFIGSSTDASMVYFTASGALAPGASAGQSNLYVYDVASGRVTFIAPGSGVGGPVVGGSFREERTSEVTPDGRHLVFVSSANLTSYRQEGLQEVYLYDAAANRLVCVSCNPSGAPPTESARLPTQFNGGDIFAQLVEMGTLPEPRAVSDDGSRVFFQSPDQLTREAPPLTTISGVQAGVSRGFESWEPNVYEYEGGHVNLVAPAARLLTVTPSGNDVFFASIDRLVPSDGDGTVDVYDARVGGGFPVLAAPACSGASCQGVPAASPIFATPASATFNGVGNFPPPSSAPVAVKHRTAIKCSKGRRLSRGKCVKVRVRRGTRARKSDHRGGR